jgi:NAD(P)-dependent dehydrogenase (short-subunit alcohol dehydrogenase family)
MGQLQDKVALIIGASPTAARRSHGSALCTRSARVVLSARRLKEAEVLPPRREAIACDITDSPR